MNVAYITLGVAVVWNVVANLLIKVGVTRFMQSGASFRFSWESVFRITTNPFLFLGVCSFVLALVFYGWSLSKLDISVGYPIFVSIGIILITLVSTLFLGESINVVQIFGMTLIISGVWLVTYFA